MRPLQLDLVAFRSYEAETVDWRPHDLVVIAGDTGAGKSSLLDGICFALYGRTPETTRSGELLTLGREHGEVRLTFARDDQVWRVTRRFGPRAPEPAHILEHLDGDGGPPIESVAGEVVNERVQALVGLGFGAFTSAVVLAQGRFAQFLQAKAADRDAILRELFGIASLEGARQAAVAAQGAQEARAEVLEDERRRLPEHGPTDLVAAARRARSAAHRRSALGLLAPLAAAVRTAHAQAERAQERVGELSAAAARLPGAAALDDLGGRLRSAVTALAAAEDQRRAAEAVAGRAAADLDLARERAGGGAAELAALVAAAERDEEAAARVPAVRAEIATARGELERADAALTGRPALQRRARAHAECDRARGALRAAEARASAAAAEEERSAAGAAAARAGLDRARALLEDARLADRAAAVRVGLAEGDPCPVCGSTVGHLEPGEPHLAEAEEAHRRAASAADEAEGVRSRAAGAAAAARAARDEAAAALAVADAELAGGGGDPDDDLAALAAEVERLEGLAAARERLAERVDGLERELARIERERTTLAERLGRWAGQPSAAVALRAALAEVTAREEELARATGGVKAAGAGAARAREALATLERGELAVLRQAAGLVAHLVGAPAPDPAAGPEEVMDAAGALAGRAARAVAEAEAAAADAREHADRCRADLAERARPLGIESLNALDPARSAAATEVAEARSRLGALTAAAARDRALADLAEAARRAAGHHRQVAADLRVDRFPRHLLQRYLTRLATGASARLETLSGGAFRFAHGQRDPLAIVDIRRGERQRPTATLSGGERFLASLALALGLADIAAESGGRLECLFLDEGFSALDAESLEQAMEGVERLAGDGRLVGVITHLPGVVERLGAAIHIRKGPDGVSRVAPAAGIAAARPARGNPHRSATRAAADIRLR
ncbi:MAG: SMC family ATPase [Miltoncostaeaceae bacterium]